MYKKNLLFLFLGLGLGLTLSFASADINKILKPVLDPVDKTKMTLPLLAQYNSDQFEYTYGRLDYMLEQLNDLQDKCSKR